MVEKEFRALLALEGSVLEVTREYLRTISSDTRDIRPHYEARIIGKEGNIILATNWVSRRDYAIKSLAKRYYR